MDIFNNYEILKVLKESDKSQTYLAIDKDSKVIHIIKKIAGPSYAYKALVGHNCHYLPKIYSCEFNGKDTIIVEEYIEGPTIDTADISQKQLQKYMISLCKALHFLHGKDIIHRDIKPSNIIIDRQDNLKLLDFDIARIENSYAENDTRLLGTKGFASPEQYGFAQTDKRTDIYSFGITIKSLLNSKRLQKKYGKIVKKCTSLDRNKRYRSTSQIIAVLYFKKIIHYLLPVMMLPVALFIGYYVFLISFGIYAYNTDDLVKSDIDIILETSLSEKDNVFSKVKIPMTDRLLDVALNIELLKDRPGTEYHQIGAVLNEYEAYNILLETNLPEDMYYVYSCFMDGYFVFGCFYAKYNAFTGKLEYEYIDHIALVEQSTGKIITSVDYKKYYDAMVWLYQQDFAEHP